MRFHKKVGGIHFFRLWKFRFSFCLAAPVAPLGSRTVQFTPYRRS